MLPMTEHSMHFLIKANRLQLKLSADSDVVMPDLGFGARACGESLNRLVARQRQQPRVSKRQALRARKR